MKLKGLVAACIAAAALVFAAVAAAALEPWTFTDTGVTCAVSSTFSNGVLHLSKPCTTDTVASAGATITDASGTFTSASFTLASASQCQGGSPRFNVYTATRTFFLGCNNVTPTINADGTATYTFTAATIAAGGNQVDVPTGTITGADILIDVQGSADITNITFNGQAEVPAAPTPKSFADCKNGGWKTFGVFKNQGDCVSFVATGGKNPPNG